MFLLSCETSCDETAFCLYDLKALRICTDILYSQADHHALYGGVVPEIACQFHLNKIDLLFNQMISDLAIQFHQIDYFAATNKPGLPGALLIGNSYLKSIAWARQKPFFGINHLAGHIYSVCIEHKVSYPHVCLSVSGGHSSIYYVKNEIDWVQLGSTRDDAAGELFDKVAKLLGLGYPGGPIIEKLAQQINFEDVYKFPRLKEKNLDFSFSGLKTAILYHLVDKGYYNLGQKNLIKFIPEEEKHCIAASLLCAVLDIFKSRLEVALQEICNFQAITFVGGVACNNFLREELRSFALKKGLEFFAPSKKYCTDNAAMIAQAAVHIVHHAPQSIPTHYMTDILI